MARKNYEIAFQFGATLHSNMRKALSSATGMVSSLDSQIRAFGKGKGQITAFQNLREAIKQNVAAMREMEAGTKRDKLSEKIKQQQQRLVSLRSALKSTGVDMRNLSSEEDRLAKSATNAAKAQAALEKATARSAAIKQQRSDFRMQMLDAYALTKTLAAPIKAAMSVETAMAGVKKTSDLADDELKQVKAAFQSMSMKYPMAMDGIAEIGSSMGTIEKTRPGLVQATRDAIKMGVAMDMSGDDAGKAAKSIRAALGLSRDEMREFADEINYAGNQGAGTAKEILNVVKSSAGLAREMGISRQTTTALATAMVGMGVDAAEAGTSLQNMNLALTSGESATTSQRKAFDALGLNPEKVARTMQKDADKMIQIVFERLQGVSADKRASVLTQLMGRSTVGAAAPLMRNFDTVLQLMTDLNDKSKTLGSVDKEVDAIMNTTGAQLTTLGNGIKVMSAAMGEHLLPVIKDGVQAVGPWLESGAKWIEQNPKLAGGIVKGVAALMAMRVATIGLGYAFTFITGPIAAADKAFKMFQAAKTLSGFGNMRTAVLLLNNAIRANPIMFVAGTVAMAAGLIISNWDEIRAGCVAAWDATTQAWGKAGEWFSEKWATVSSVFSNAWGGITGAAGSAWDAFTAPAKVAFDWLAKKFAWVEEGLAKVSQGWGSVKSFFGMGDSKGSQEIPQFARGGEVSRPTMAMVGEGGNTESIIPHDGSKRALGLWARAGSALGVRPQSSGNSSGGAVNFTFHNTNNFNGAADKNTVTQAMEMSKQKFKQMLNELMRDNSRVRLA